MKKVMFALTMVLSLGGSFASADLVVPSQSVITGDEARAVYEQIIESTGKKPQEYGNKKIVNAEATISCTEYRTDGKVACRINNLK